MSDFEEVRRLYILVLREKWIPEVENPFEYGDEFYIISYDKIPSRDVVPCSTFFKPEKII